MKFIDKISTKLFGLNRSVILLFVFSILGSVNNYVFQVVLGKLLILSDYAEFSTIYSLVSNLLCLYSPLAVHACRMSAEHQDSLSVNSMNYQRLFIFTIMVSLLLMGGGGFSFFATSARLGIESFSLWILILIMTGIAGVYTVLIGIIQGSGRLGWYGFLGLFLTVVKLGGAYAGVKLGGRVPAVVWAMFISYLLVICFSIAIIGLTIRNQYKEGRQQIKSAIGYKEILQLYGTTFLVQALISLYINGGEIILMSSLYDKETVGTYSLAAPIAKISIHVLSIFTAALLPNISADWSMGKSIKRKFKIMTIFSLGVGIVWFIFLFIPGRQLVLVLLGNKYYEALSNIKYMAFWIIGLGVLITVNTFYLAINRLKNYLIMLAIVTTGILATVVIGDIAMVYVPVVSGVGTFLIVLFAFIEIKGLKNPNDLKEEG